MNAAKTEPALELKLRRLTALVTRVGIALKRLGSASRAEQRALARTLQAAADESRKIGEGLK